MSKQFQIILLLCLVSVLGNAQIKTNLVGDSIHIHSNAGAGELILQNSTQNVPGFLFNKGAGRTEFRRGLITLTDTSYVIGGDTLILRNGETITSKNIFYVTKKYNGIAKAKVSGYSLTSISSTNPEYTKQLSIAKPGSLANPYPDPLSARNAALDAMASGAITTATVVVLEENKYTIGSDDSTKNGSLNGTAPNNGTVADIQFSLNAVTADEGLSSLMKNNLNLYFNSGSSLTFINSGYAIWCSFHAGTTAFRSGIYGQGSFYQVYGEINGFVANFIRVENGYSYVDFHAHEVILQQWNGFQYRNFTIANIDIDNLISADATVFRIGSAGAIGNPRILNIKVKNCKWGKGQTPYPDSGDNWYFIMFGGQAADKTIATFDIDNFYMSSGNENALFYIASGTAMLNSQVTVNISNFVQRDSHQSYSGSFGLIGNYGTGLALNSSLQFNFKNADIDAPLLGNFNVSWDTSSKNNILSINAGTLIKNASSFPNGIFNMTNNNSSSAQPLTVKVNGYFKSFDNGPLIFTQGGAPFNHYQFSGHYETATPGQPVVKLNANTGKVIGLTDAILLNDGVTNSIISGSPAAPVYIKNVHSNASVDANTSQVGDTIKVVTDLPLYIK